MYVSFSCIEPWIWLPAKPPPNAPATVAMSLPRPPPNWWPITPPATAPSTEPAIRFSSCTGLRWVTVTLRHSWRGVFTVSLIGVAETTCANCGPRSKTFRLATAATPSAAATPIPIPANMDLFTGHPPFLLLATTLQQEVRDANQNGDEKSGSKSPNSVIQTVLNHAG